MHRYFVIYKPFNMVSQFVSPHKVNLLGDLNFNFPEGTKAVGRLDSHSEGLLILTTNPRLQNQLFLGEVPHKRTYLVLVRDRMSDERVARLRDGIEIKIKGGGNYVTQACDIEIVSAPKNLAESIFAYDEGIPHTWLKISLVEGKFHQVRKMMKAVHHPVRRLIRLSIEDLEVADMLPGEVRELQEQEIYERLKITLIN